MSMIEVDRAVFEKLEEIAESAGVTRNCVLRKLLDIDSSAIKGRGYTENSIRRAKHHSTFKNIQDELIPYIVRVLYENGGKATKAFVEKEVSVLFQPEFE